MKLDDLIGSLVTKRNQPPPAAQPDGGFTLSIDGQYEIRCLPMGSGRAVLATILSDLPDNPRRREELLTWLMRLNLAYLKRSRSVLSVDNQTGQLFLHYNVSLAEITQSGFETALRDFLNDIDFWRECREARASPVPSPVMVFP